MTTPSRFRRLFRLDRGAADVERAIDDELKFHFDLTVRELMSKGATEQDARDEAGRRFGDVERTRRSLSALDHARANEARRTEWWNNVGQDMGYALRGFRRRPGFTIAVALILALGIGANATMFGIIDRVLFRAPAYLVRASDVHRVYLGEWWKGKEAFSTNMSYLRYRELTDSVNAIDVGAAFWSMSMPVGVGEPVEMRVDAVTANFWSLFDARPHIGRFFSADEERPPIGSAVAVLTYGYWQTAYAGRDDVLGKQIRIGRVDYTVVGVTPPGFAGVSVRSPIAFLPLLSAAANVFGAPGPKNRWSSAHGMIWLELLVRRKPGVSVAALNAQLNGAYRRSRNAERIERPDIAPDSETRPRALAAPVLAQRGPQRSADAKVAIWLVGVAIMVLVIACANVSNLLLARALQRRREIAVRLALGISRARLLGQLLTESVLLAFIGGVAGLVVAEWGGRILRTTLLPANTWTNALADSRVLLFTGVIALTTGILAGLAPALHAGRYDVSSALKAGSREGTYQRSRIRTSLLVLQGALSVVLLVGAGLFVRSFNSVRTMRLGYDAEHLTYVELSMRGERLDSARRTALMGDLVRTAATIPGVQSATTGVSVPFYFDWSEDVFVAGMDSTSRLGRFLAQSVSPEYFTTMGTRIVRGRGITSNDRVGAPGAIVVSESMARALWGARNALGECVRLGATTEPCWYVVGIAEDTKRSSLDHDPGLQFYVSREQRWSRMEGVFIRTKGLADQQVAVVRRGLQRVMPGASYVTPMSFEKILGREQRSWRLGATMFSLFGLLALVVAAVGLYSVVAYTVAQRTQELGVRVALGARFGHVVKLVISEMVGVAAVAVGLGLLLALGLSRWVEPLLFETSARDPMVFSVVAGTLMVVAIGAALGPAIRAARVDPSVALRAD